MAYYLSFDSIQKVLKKHKNCRLDSYLIHAAAQCTKGCFSAKTLADAIDVKPGAVTRAINKSTYFRNCEDLFCKRERLTGLYQEAFVEVTDGKVKPVDLSDPVHANALIKEPLIGYIMEVVKKYGEHITLFDMAIQLAVYEGCTTFEALSERLATDGEQIRTAIDNLVEDKILLSKTVDGEIHYSFNHKSSDIFSIIFKARAAQPQK